MTLSSEHDSNKDAQQLQEIIYWLLNEGEKRVAQAMARRPKGMRGLSAKQLKEAKQMAEKMAGRKLPYATSTVKANIEFCDMQDRIADKLEAEGRRLCAWADFLSGQAPSDRG